MESFVGVCGVQAVEDACVLQEIWAGLGVPRVLGIGVLQVDNSTAIDLTPDWAHRCADVGTVNAIAEVLDADVAQLCLHYAAPGGGLVQGLGGALSAMPRVARIQINSGVAPDEILAIRQNHPRVELGWQWSPSKQRGSPSVDRADLFTKLDFVLVDDSCGRGRSLDTALASAHLEFALSNGANHVAVAGGLDRYAAAQLRELVSGFPRVSWDAESRIRDSADRLDLALAEDYLKMSASALGDVNADSSGSGTT